MSRLPTKGDFEKPINPMVGPSPPDHAMRPPPKLDIIPPSSGSPVNVLILLHGLGDTKAPFAQFAQNMNLKETVCISLQGPTPLPDIFNPLDRPAFHWSDDITFEDDRLNIDNGFEATSKLISEHVIPVLHHKCNFPLRNIFFFGFGQGGMAALHAVTQCSGNEEFGGVISIGGRFPESTRLTSAGKNRTPVLACAGSRSQEVNQTSLHTLREKFQDVEYVKWMKHDDSMPKNAEEMRPIFALLARRMRSRAGVPEGAVEI